LTTPQKGADYQSQVDDSEPLSLTKAELAKMIEDGANKLAPTIAKQKATEEQIRSAALSVRESLGNDEFETITDELADIFPQDKQLTLLQAENPAELIKYLADPDHASEAEKLSSLSDFQFGLAVAKLQTKLAAKTAKPQSSKAPEPLTLSRATASANSALPQDSDSIEVWNAKEAARMKSKGLIRY
jgi:hypothetical protein